MAKIHEKYVIELAEIIKGYGNDPQIKEPFNLPCDYKFYEIDGVAICEESFNKMKPLEDIALPKDQYIQRLKADMAAMLTELQIEIEKIDIPKDVKTVEGSFACCDILVKVDEVIQKKIDKLKET